MSVTALRMKWSARWLILPLLAVTLCLGCARSTVPTGTVQGKVTFNGAPYTNAAVCFLDMKTGQAASADIQADGTFQVKNPVQVGEYNVYLAPKAAGASDEPKPVKIDQTVPDKYWSEATTDLKAKVVEGKNDIEVKLVK